MCYYQLLSACLLCFAPFLSFWIRENGETGFLVFHFSAHFSILLGLYNTLWNEFIYREKKNFVKKKKKKHFALLSEIWDALRAAAEAELSLAQAIIDSAGVIVQNPDLTICYDERGE